MADIRNEIAAIQVATTGAEIRTALINALNAINVDQGWTADDVPTEDSTNLAKSGGIYSALQEIQKKLTTGRINIPPAWSGEDPYSQAISIPAATEFSKVDLQPTVDTLQHLLSEGVLAFWVENDEGVLTAYTIGGHPTETVRFQYTLTETQEISST